ncbi:DUF4269 domain-containing protein [Persicobacter diffluens]|uniref:Alpha/beta hydrolase n=1 Tax=Persicobacter diffluens TaxID=981 RepID=A0AAN4W030_9BACT|nr:alpha/beta hydrolase [Persicobacter diffluens]
MDFKQIDYLKMGNSRQQKAYDVLTAFQVFEKLKPYTPLLAGTIPIEIDLPGSDLDIICECGDHEDFASFLKETFGTMEGFEMKMKMFQGRTSTIANFTLEGIPVEIFGQQYPSAQQHAFRHMLVEHRILQERGVCFKAEVIRLKTEGMKTEPAFAYLLALEGDPYLALLELE